MKESKVKIASASKGPIYPFKVDQALAGLGLDEADDAVLKYLGYLLGHLPISKLSFVHVIPAIYLFDQRDGVEGQMFDTYELGKDVTTKVAKKIAAEITNRHKVQVNFEVRDGNPLDELIEQSEVSKADLVIIGKNSKRENHGILARNFARKATCNSLFVPDKVKLSMRKILAPMDFSPYSLEALRTAIAISKTYKIPPKIVALHIYQMPAIPGFLLRKTEDEMRQVLIEDRQAAFKAFFDTYIPKEDQDKIESVIVEQLHPGVGNYIVEYANENKVDLIVLGAKGHSKVGLLLLGSVTEKVLTLTKKQAVFVVKQ